MKNNKFLNLLFAAFAFPVVHTTYVDDLPKINIDHRTVTISGVSAGGAMALQALVAASDQFMGAGSFAGVTYGCAKNSVDVARTVCMKGVDKVEVDELQKMTRSKSAKGEIDPIENLKNRKLFIYHGSKDNVVNPLSSQKILDWAEAFFKPNLISADARVSAGHGMPTVDYGNPCTSERIPWLNKCNYDGARAVLTHMYGPLQRASTSQGSIVAFKQSSYNIQGSNLAETGYLYIPKTCNTPGSGCRLHIALHGCQQSPQFVGTNYVENSGYNRVAETNRIVVLYPSVTASMSNPAGCWDWWGYSGRNYLTKKAPQIQSLLMMIQALK